MNWADIGKTVARVAPVLGGVLGGPVGAIAGAAGSLVASFLGCEPEPEAVAKIVADPAALARLQELEIRKQETILDWQAKQLDAELKNTTDARAKEVNLAKSGSKTVWATPAVALVVTVGFFMLLFAVLEKGPGEINQAALILLGTLGTGFGSVVNYYLGSSLGSTQKNDMLRVGK